MRRGFLIQRGGSLRRGGRRINATKKEFIGTCVDNPFGDMGTLVNVVDNHSRETDVREFLANCHVHPEVIEEMQRFPNDFGFYKSKVLWDQPYSIYFYRHSAVEHFYA